MARERVARSVRPSRRRLSARARLLLGAGGLAAIVLAIVLARSGGGGSGPPQTAPRPAPLPPLREAYANPPMGAFGLLPAGWLAVKGPGLLQLSDRSGEATVLIVALRAGPRAALLRDAVGELRRRYGPLSIRAAPGSRLGGLPASSVVVYARNAHHVRVRILLAVARAPTRAYILEAATPVHAPVGELVESQEVLNALRLRG